MNASIIRLEFTSQGTVGQLLLDDSIFCYTLERPWANNAQNISCIPCGSYKCYKVDSPKFGTTYEVEEVKNRSDILFHWGNTIDDTQGCILLGKEVGFINDKRAVLSSRNTFTSFMKNVGGISSFYLRIMELRSNE